MTAELLLPSPRFYPLNNAGLTVPGGKIFSYAAGTTTKLATFTDSTGATPNLNPIIMDAGGGCNCWIPPGTAYKIVFSPSTDTDPPTNAFWTTDQVTTGLFGITSFSDGAINVGTPTGGDKGAGTINVAVGYFVNGVPGSLYFTSTPQAVSVAGAYTLAHSLGAEPAWVFAELQCTTAESGYAIGAHVQIGPGFTSTNRGLSFSKGVKYITIFLGSDPGVIDIIRADNHLSTTITPANWNIVFKARA